MEDEQFLKFIKKCNRKAKLELDRLRNQCSDHDEDCKSIEDKLHCHLHDTSTGFCPFLNHDN